MELSTTMLLMLIAYSLVSLVLSIPTVLKAGIKYDKKSTYQAPKQYKLDKCTYFFSVFVMFIFCFFSALIPDTFNPSSIFIAFLATQAINIAVFYFAKHHIRPKREGKYSAILVENAFYQSLLDQRDRIREEAETKYTPLANIIKDIADYEARKDHPTID